MWIDNILNNMQSTFKTKKLSGSWHDEYVVAFKDSPKAREVMEKITLAAIEQVNDTYLLRRKLGCDIQFGKRYSEIH